MAPTAPTTAPPPLYVLDTNVLIFYSRGKEATYELLEAEYQFSMQWAACFVSVVTIAEVESFMRQQGWGPRRIDAARTDILSKVLAIDISHTDEALLDAYVVIDNASRANRRGAIAMGKNDLWIAATARVLSATLVTTDKDFDHLHGTLITRHYIDQQHGVVVK